MELNKQKRLVSQSFLGSDSELILSKARIAIIGLSGGGSHVALQLSHVGVGNFVVIDYDHVEEKNLNRMVGATARDARLGTLKTKVIRRVIKAVNPRATVLAVPKKWQEEAEILRDCDVIFGCVDTFSERQQLEVAARRYLIPYIDVGMDVCTVDDGFSIGGQVALSIPGELCLRCYGILTDEQLSREAARYGAAGSRPQVVWANGVLASAAVGICVQLFCPWRSRQLRGILREFDGESHTLTTSNKMSYLKDIQCLHFSDSSTVGDPFWKPTAFRSSKRV
jgi:molybdopterin/thiamine biosynthesis adenylyltransferase